MIAVVVRSATGELTQHSVYFFLGYAHASAELTGSGADASVA